MLGDYLFNSKRKNKEVSYEKKIPQNQDL